MTLHAFLGAGGRVLVAAHPPRIESVALRAIASEALEVRVPSIVADGAIQGLARGALVELIGTLNLEPGLQGRERCGAVGVRARCALQCSGSETSELHVVHHQGADARALMLDVARRTFPDARMERAGLTAKQSFRRGVARLPRRPMRVVSRVHGGRDGRQMHGVPRHV